MIDLNDLRVFERVASLCSFAGAARALDLPKSSVSRSVQALERSLGARLLQRTPREVKLTYAGEMLLQRCAPLLGGLHEAVATLETFVEHPRGRLVIGVGVAFGVRVLGSIVPDFCRRYPEIDVVIRIGGILKDEGDDIDVAIRIGPLPSSSYVVKRLGGMTQYLCASPDYLQGRKAPAHPCDLASHDVLQYPGRGDRRARTWSFSRGDEQVTVDAPPRILVNDALTIHQLALCGGGVAGLSSYLCGDDIVAGRLMRLLPDWTLPDVDVHVGFPSRRELAPSVRAFVDYLEQVSGPGRLWRADALSDDERLGTPFQVVTTADRPARQ